VDRYTQFFAPGVTGDIADGHSVTVIRLQKSAFSYPGTPSGLPKAL
jgi:hypothetical protein